MVSRVKTPLLVEAEERLGRVPRGGIARVAQSAGLPVGRLRKIAKGVEPTGSARIGPAHQQVQRVVYELRKLQDMPAQTSDTTTAVLPERQRNSAQ